MALKGQAKTDYQREYMRKLRSKGRALDPSVRPPTFRLVPSGTYKEVKRIPELDADGNIIPEY